MLKLYICLFKNYVDLAYALPAVIVNRSVGTALLLFIVCTISA